MAGIKSILSGGCTAPAVFAMRGKHCFFSVHHIPLTVAAIGGHNDGAGIAALYINKQERKQKNVISCRDKKIYR